MRSSSGPLHRSATGQDSMLNAGPRLSPASRQAGTQLFICTAYDTFQGRRLTLAEQFSVATKPSGKNGGKRDERAALPNRIELAIGMKVMATFNVETDLDIANGARGETIKIVLDERETAFSASVSIVELAYPPAYIRLFH